MGQKVSPNGLRVGVIKKWQTNWITSKENQAVFLNEDVNLRKAINKALGRAAMVSKVLISRKDDKAVDVDIFSAKPGFIMGENGESLKKLTITLSKAIKRARVVNIKINEEKNPDASAKLLAESIAEQLENRASFRTVQKRAIQRAMRAGLKGIKTQVSGRLAGADMARAEGYSDGVVPLHTLRSDVEYHLDEALTTYGLLGVKVWVCHGEVLEGMK